MDMPQRPEFIQEPDGTFTIRNLEVFRAGDYGGKGAYGEAELEAIARGYSPSLCEAPITLDHKQEGPAFGWVSRVVRAGSRLIADLRQVSGQMFQALKSGAYKKRSVEIYRSAEFAGGKPYLKAVSFLGAAIPHVKGMADPQFKFRADAGDAEAFDFDATPADRAPVVFSLPAELYPRPRGIKAGTLVDERSTGEFLGHHHKALTDADGNGYTSAPLYWDAERCNFGVLDQDAKGFHQHAISGGVIAESDDGLGNVHVHSLDMQFSASHRKEGIVIMPDTPTTGNQPAEFADFKAKVIALESEQKRLADEKKAAEEKANATAAAFAAFKAETERKERLAAFQTTLDKAAREGRIAPAERPNIEAFAAYLAGQEPATVVKFSQSAGAAIDLDPLSAFGSLLAARPAVIDLAKTPQTDNKSMLTGPPPDRKAEPAQFSEYRHQKALAIMDEKKAPDYATALSMADKEIGNS